MKDNNNDGFILLIRHLLIDHDMSQADLASQMDVTESAVSRWISGRKDMPITLQYVVIHYFYDTLGDSDLCEIDEALKNAVFAGEKVQDLSNSINVKRRKNRIEKETERIKRKQGVLNAIDAKSDKYESEASTDEWIASITRTIPINERA